MSANGYLSASELAPIDNGQFLRPDAASRWMALRAAAAADGYNIITTEGYRDYDTQVYLRNLYLAGKGYPAGIPGTSSHGWGLAVDINTYSWTSPIYLWMQANAAAYGFNNNQGRDDGEHWHWVYDGGGFAGIGYAVPIKREEMSKFYPFTNQKTRTLKDGQTAIFANDADSGVNLIGGTGNYQFVTRVHGVGGAADATLDVWLEIRTPGSTAVSRSFVETVNVPAGKPFKYTYSDAFPVLDSPRVVVGLMTARGGDVTVNLVSCRATMTIPA